MGFYPIHLRLTGRPCAVVGGGVVAARKVAALAEAEADITIISPVLAPELAVKVVTGAFSHRSREYKAGDLAGFFLVVCATDNPMVNRAAAEEARAGGALVNVADDPAASDWHDPARITRGDLVVTVSTGGRSPALARQIKAEFDALLGPEYLRYLELMGRLREEVRPGGDPSARRSVWRELMETGILDLLRQDRVAEAEEKIRDAFGRIGTQP